MISLIGHGYIGRYIAEELNNQKIPYQWVTHSQEISPQTKIIINAAGYTGIPNVDACELNKNACIQGNVIYPLELERKYKLPIIHISSGCVYTGYKDGGWLESDEPNFYFDNGSFYSASKTLAQKLLEPYMNKSYLLRVRMPFGPDRKDKNLLTKIIKYDKLIDNLNSVTNVEELAKCAVFFAISRPEPGIYNAVNPTPVTTRDISDMLGLEKQWVNEKEFKSFTVAPRSNCVLNTDKMQSVFKFKPALESIRNTIITFNK